MQNNALCNQWFSSVNRFCSSASARPRHLRPGNRCQVFDHSHCLDHNHFPPQGIDTCSIPLQIGIISLARTNRIDEARKHGFWLTVINPRPRQILHRRSTINKNSRRQRSPREIMITWMPPILALRLHIDKQFTDKERLSYTLKCGFTVRYNYWRRMQSFALKSNEYNEFMQ
jgi:hypothetical protein